MLNHHPHKPEDKLSRLNKKLAVFSIAAYGAGIMAAQAVIPGEVAIATTLGTGIVLVGASLKSKS